MSFLKLLILVSFSAFVAAFSFFISMKKSAANHFEIFNNNYTDTVKSGRQLAEQYCSGCHLFPEPALLDKKTWVNHVLPNMGFRLGIYEEGKDPYANLPPEEEKIMRQLGIYPELPLLSKENWRKIVSYYEKDSPAEPHPQKSTDPFFNELIQFKATAIDIEKKPLPRTTLLKFDKVTSQIYVGDAQNLLYALDGNFQLKNKLNTESPPTDIDFPKNGLPRVLTIGIFNPSDQKLGRLHTLDKLTDTIPSRMNIPRLPRPVQFATAALNLDGKEDVVVCGFGNNTGKLMWFDDFQPTKEHVLKALPGAIRVEIADLNRDKKPDIVVLMAQSWEGVSVFYNLGNGKFKEKKVLQLPAVYGVSYFELVDFNKDGFQDILLTNGDNWDLSRIRKNYHGIRLYLNDKKDNFKEAFFYPLYGATKAVARDFDGDGDLDIAAISFYNDFEKPEQGFVYLSNTGGGNFKTFITPLAADGKWLTMETGDFDQDGDIDIVLGSYFHNVAELSKLVFRGVTVFPQLLLLTNQKKN